MLTYFRLDLNGAKMHKVKSLYRKYHSWLNIDVDLNGTLDLLSLSSTSSDLKNIASRPKG